MTTITVTKRDGTTKSVDSPYTDYEIGEVLVRYLEEGKLPSTKRDGSPTFSASLRQSHDRYGLSEAQTRWAHILVVQADTPRQEAAPTATLPRIRRMMDAAAAEIRYPKINCHTESGMYLRLSLAGERSRNPGVINITDGRPYGCNTFYGRIDLQGGLVAGRGMVDEVQDFLTTFDAQPELVATAYGHRTGSCCFCSRTLTDGRSVAKGYGPICADRYGLPWGDERASSTVDLSVVNTEAGASACDCGSPTCTDGNDGEADLADLQSGMEVQA